MDEQQIRFRDWVRTIAPNWLVNTNGYKLMYCLGLMFDILIDNAWAAIKLRFAGLYTLDPLALSLQGQERKLRQGLFEQIDPASGAYSREGALRYARRLRRWHQAWQYRGGPYELLEQIRAYHAPEEALTVQIIYRSGRRYTLYKSPTGWDVARDDITDWNPDATPEKWATFRIYIIGLPVYHIPGLDPVIRDRAVADLKALISDFTAAHCQGTVTITPTRGGTWDELPTPPSQSFIGEPMTWDYDPLLDPDLLDPTDEQWSYNGGIPDATVTPITFSIP